MNELALFAGAGGGILGGKLLGWKTICAVELDAFCARRLMQRQNEGHLPPFPIWDDVRSFYGLPWRGAVDVVSGGFPCQDISAAGKGAGIDGERSGLWKEMSRIIGEVQPRFAFLENSPVLTSRGLGRVLGDLAEMGFDAEWGVLGAHHAGAPHKRDRIWIVAHSDSNGVEGGVRKARKSSGKVGAKSWMETGGSRKNLANANRELLDRCGAPGAPGRIELADGGEVRDTNGARLEERDGSERTDRTCSSVEFANWWSTEPRLGRVAHGVAHRVDRLRAIGNGQVPAVAAMAFRELSERLRGK